jgi:hypothetical protein
LLTSFCRFIVALPLTLAPIYGLSSKRPVSMILATTHVRAIANPCGDLDASISGRREQPPARAKARSSLADANHDHNAEGLCSPSVVL